MTNFCRNPCNSKGFPYFFLPLYFLQHILPRCREKHFYNTILHILSVLKLTSWNSTLFATKQILILVFYSSSCLCSHFAMRLRQSVAVLKLISYYSTHFAIICFMGPFSSSALHLTCYQNNFLLKWREKRVHGYHRREPATCSAWEARWKLAPSSTVKSRWDKAFVKSWIILAFYLISTLFCTWI